MPPRSVAAATLLFAQALGQSQADGAVTGPAASGAYAAAVPPSSGQPAGIDLIPPQSLLASGRAIDLTV